MMIVGLTGGIGSGKTTIAKMFKKLGVPIYIADVEAKALTNSSQEIKKELIELLGEEAYINALLNKKYVANLIFNDKELLSRVNAIIHPRVAAHFNEWYDTQKAPYCIKEAAILFENGGYKKCDYTILITAPLETRIARVIKRDSSTVEEVKSRIKNQWDDDKKSELADFIIESIDFKTSQQKVNEIHLFLLKG